MCLPPGLFLVVQLLCQSGCSTVNNDLNLPGNYLSLSRTMSSISLLMGRVRTKNLIVYVIPVRLDRTPGSCLAGTMRNSHILNPLNLGAHYFNFILHCLTPNNFILSRGECCHSVLATQTICPCIMLTFALTYPIQYFIISLCLVLSLNGLNRVHQGYAR
jgi:hypothetical protein